MPAPHGLPDRSAAPIEIRPLARADRARLAAAFERLSDRSRQLRFLGPKPRLSSSELTYLTEIDHRRHEAIVAIDAATDRIVGVARYAAMHGEEGSADLAVVVADEWQGHGLGPRLVRALIGRAEANGVERLVATTLSENRPARAMLRRIGFRTSSLAGGVLDLELLLPSPIPAGAVSRGQAA
jgi:RimJ/RimL family protein N-acetyltransferase